jgi:hypothetical protein
VERHCGLTRRYQIALRILYDPDQSSRPSSRRPAEAMIAGLRARAPPYSPACITFGQVSSHSAHGGSDVQSGIVGFHIRCCRQTTRSREFSSGRRRCLTTVKRQFECCPFRFSLRYLSVSATPMLRRCFEIKSYRLDFWIHINNSSNISQRRQKNLSVRRNFLHIQ